MWTWIGGQTNINLCGSFGTRGIESVNNKLQSVQGEAMFAEENPLRLYTWGGSGYASSVSSGCTSRFKEGERFVSRFSKVAIGELCNPIVLRALSTGITTRFSVSHAPQVCSRKP